MKVRNGYPTIKALNDICEKHGLRTHVISDFYKYRKAIVYGREYQNEIAKKVNEDVSKFFKTEFRLANGITKGEILFLSKLEQSSND